MIRDGRRLNESGLSAFDVVIVGAGMAGITLAERLRGAGRRICVLESGGYDPGAAVQRLLSGRNVGRPYFALDRCRFAVFGGSSIRWGGWCRPLDPIDFRERSWMPLSGWPIDRGELEPHYAEAARILSLATDNFNPADWIHRIPPPPPLSGRFEAAVIQHGAQIDFGERWRASLAAAEDVTVLLHATATELILGADGDRVDRVRVGSLRGRRFDLRAETIVLAAGGIENARLLLASRGRYRAGVGNESDHVGRCFMEHLHVAPAYVVPREDVPFPGFFEHSLGDDRPGHGVLTPTEDALIEQRSTSCSISIASTSSAMGVIPRLDWRPSLMAATETTARRLRRHRPGIDARVRRVALATWKSARTAHLDRRLPRMHQTDGVAPMVAYVRAEQAPTPRSRITLGPSRDALGTPHVRLDWQLTPQDLAGVRRWTEDLADTLRAGGLGHVVMRDGWESEISGGPHHMGTTRMSSSPQDGVVDANCRVHSVANLFVAGSSVFATSGHANPSFTVLALTLRLADHLQGRLDHGGVGGDRERSPAPPPSGRSEVSCQKV